MTIVVGKLVSTAFSILPLMHVTSIRIFHMFPRGYPFLDKENKFI
jgi:hypothetical protein